MYKLKRAVIQFNQLQPPKGIYSFLTYALMLPRHRGLMSTACHDINVLQVPAQRPSFLVAPIDPFHRRKRIDTTRQSYPPTSYVKTKYFSKLSTFQLRQPDYHKRPVIHEHITIRLNATPDHAFNLRVTLPTQILKAETEVFKHPCGLLLSLSSEFYVLWA